MLQRIGIQSVLMSLGPLHGGRDRNPATRLEWLSILRMMLVHGDVAGKA